MNVAEIRQRIFDQMDYNPDLQQYRDSVVRRMSDQYQAINDSAHWLFLQTEKELQLRAKVSGSSTVSVYPTSGNVRELTCTGFTPTIEMNGQRIKDTAGTEFVIVRVLGSNLYIEPVTEGIDTGYSTSYNVSSQDTGFSITFPRIPLPSDCIEIMGLTDRENDRGRLLYVNRKREENAYLDRDNTGEPSVAVDDEFILDEPPRLNPTAATDATNGDLLTSTTYAYRYTIYREGRESPPSLAIQASTVGTNESIKVSNMDDTRWRNSSGVLADSGIAKFLYRRDVTNDGPWMLIKVLEASATNTYTDSALTPTDIGKYGVNTNWYYSSDEDIIRYNDPGPYQNLRFWYVPDTDRKIHMRYLRRPRDLQADNDTPEWPRHYHPILVYKTLEDLFLQMQDIGQAQIFGARAMVLQDQMRKRYLSRVDIQKRFQRFDRPRRYRSIYGIPSTNFEGA